MTDPLFFDAVLLASLLFRFIPHLKEDFIAYITTHATLSESMKGVLTYFEENTTAITVSVAIIAGTLTICSLLGAVSVWSDCYLVVHTTTMGFLILAETIALGTIFGVPGLFQNVIFDIMNKTLKDYNEKGESGLIAVALWNVITIDENSYCCGLYSNLDYGAAKVLPYGCCAQIHSKPECTSSRVNRSLPACEAKIHMFISDHKSTLIIICSTFIAIQFIIFTLSVIILASIKPSNREPSKRSSTHRGAAPYPMPNATPQEIDAAGPLPRVLNRY